MSDDYSLIGAIAALGKPSQDKGEKYGALVEKTAAAMVAAFLKASSLSDLRQLNERLGADVTARVLSRLKDNEAVALAKGWDKDHPEMKSPTPHRAKQHILELANGTEPHKPYDLATMDLDALRSARFDLQDGFKAWIVEQRDPKLKSILKRIDGYLPGLSKARGKTLTDRLTALAEGTEPCAEWRIDTMNVESLRTARSTLGRELFENLLTDQKKHLKPALIRLDQHRKKVDKLPGGEYHAYVLEIAEGGALVRPEGSGLDIGAKQFPMDGSFKD